MQFACPVAVIKSRSSVLNSIFAHWFGRRRCSLELGIFLILSPLDLAERISRHCYRRYEQIGDSRMIWLPILTIGKETRDNGRIGIVQKVRHNGLSSHSSSVSFSRFNSSIAHEQFTRDNANFTSSGCPGGRLQRSIIACKALSPPVHLSFTISSRVPPSPLVFMSTIKTTPLKPPS
ncbi:hypothetical protein C8J56DRAFT_32270 [Mycena floridula]|nr:hypothetical protein C8J56DRAFT_32270 [Mycena floridula]